MMSFFSLYIARLQVHPLFVLLRSCCIRIAFDKTRPILALRYFVNRAQRVRAPCLTPWRLSGISSSLNTCSNCFFLLLCFYMNIPLFFRGRGVFWLGRLSPTSQRLHNKGGRSIVNRFFFLNKSKLCSLLLYFSSVANLIFFSAFNCYFWCFHASWGLRSIWQRNEGTLLLFKKNFLQLRNVCLIEPPNGMAETLRNPNDFLIVDISFSRYKGRHHRFMDADSIPMRKSNQRFFFLF